MSNQQPGALQLAARLDPVHSASTTLLDLHREAAAELRRLHAANLDCMEWYEAIKSDYEKLKAEHEALRKAVIKLHAAKGRHHAQLAACDLFDLCGLKNERPTK